MSTVAGRSTAALAMKRRMTGLRQRGGHRWQARPKPKSAATAELLQRVKWPAITSNRRRLKLRQQPHRPANRFVRGRDCLRRLE
jgi:hypothetical protein